MRIKLEDLLRDTTLHAPPNWRKIQVEIDASIRTLSDDADFFNKLRNVRTQLEQANINVKSTYNPDNKTLTLTITR